MSDQPAHLLRIIDGEKGQRIDGALPIRWTRRVTKYRPRMAAKIPADATIIYPDGARADLAAGDWLLLDDQGHVTHVAAAWFAQSWYEADEDPAVALIANERRRQILAEGHTPENDDALADGQLAQAAALYAAPCPLVNVQHVEPWPAGIEDKRPGVEGDAIPGALLPPAVRIKLLAKAGALIAAEITRLQRAEEAAQNQSELFEENHANTN